MVEDGSEFFEAFNVLGTRRSVRNSAKIFNSVLRGFRRINNQSQGGLHLEVGLGKMSFSVEDLEGIGLSVNQTKGVEGNRSTEGTVNSSEIDSEFSVNEDPDVIITSKGEGVSTSNVVGEGGGEFSGEVEVVRVSFISKSEVINGEEGVAFKSEETSTVVN